MNAKPNIPPPPSVDAHTTASVLSEALPYIQRHKGATIVIKYGGHAMTDNALKDAFVHDVMIMRLVGMQPVVVHGGGPQISEALEKSGHESKFVDGIRVTDTETMQVVERVLGGVINGEIVEMINALGGRARGLSGKTIDADGAHLIRASKWQPDHHATHNTAPVDYGHVGEVAGINPAPLHELHAQDCIPVIAPIGVGDDEHAYNINADLVAGAIAAAMRAEKLMLLTNTAGVLDSRGELLPELHPREIQQLLDNGGISGGMIPKVECALDALNAGARSALIVDGRVRHALLLELFTNAGVGTQICAHDD